MLPRNFFRPSASSESELFFGKKRARWGAVSLRWGRYSRQETRFVAELHKWKTLASQMAFDHAWYKVRRDRVQLPNGTVIDDYFLSVRPDVALVLPVTRAGELVFVRQYRHGAGEILLELPAGTFDPAQEAPQAAAQRELLEETGHTASTWISLGVLYDNPVKETNKIHVFLAQNAQKTAAQTLDTTEEIEIVLIPPAELVAKIEVGDICVAGSVAAVFLGLAYLQRQAAQG